MRILLGVLGVASGAIAFLCGWATLFLLQVGGTVHFFGVPLTLPWAALLLVSLTAVSAACTTGSVRATRQHA